eukprot:g1907.t1
MIRDKRRELELWESKGSMFDHTGQLQGSSVYTVGQNSYGELGLEVDDVERRCCPTFVNFCKDKNVVGISAGNEHTVVLCANGDLYTCGYNDSGQCGVGRTGHVIAFEKAKNLEGVQVSSICCANGCEHNLIITDSGLLYSCGYNARGQLGHGHTSRVLVPTLVEGPFLRRRVKLVACSYYHSVAFTAPRGGDATDNSTTEVFAFGRNDHGQLGLADTAFRAGPTPIPSLSGKRVVALACGQYHTLIAVDGEGVVACGKNDYGQLGVTTGPVEVPVPVTIPTYSLGLGNSKRPVSREGAVPSGIGISTDISVVELAAGYYHSVAVTSDGGVYTFGRNDYGQLGLGHLDHAFQPQAVRGLIENKVIKSAASGCYHTVVLDENGSVYAFGRNNHGQLGTGTTIDCDVPMNVKIEMPPGCSVVAIAAGFYHSVFLTALEQSAIASRDRKGGGGSSLVWDLRALVNQEARSDVTFIVEGRPIYAHRCIIMARCEPLEIMLDGPMKESQMGKITIPDTRYEVFLAFLEFLYTDDVLALREISFNNLKDMEKEGNQLLQLSSLVGGGGCSQSSFPSVSPSTIKKGAKSKSPINSVASSDSRGRGKDDEQREQRLEQQDDQDIQHQLQVDEQKQLNSTLNEDQQHHDYDNKNKNSVEEEKSNRDCDNRDEDEKAQHEKDDHNNDNSSLNQNVDFEKTELQQNQRTENNEPELSEPLSEVDFLMDLLRLADQFLVNRLKAFCASFLLKRITVENCSWLLKTSDACNAPELRKRSFRFVLQHFGDVIATSDFSNLPPPLLQEVLFEAKRRGAYLRRPP